MEVPGSRPCPRSFRAGLGGLVRPCHIQPRQRTPGYHMAACLHRVRQFVRHQVTALGDVGLVMAGTEVDVASKGEGLGTS